MNSVFLSLGSNIDRVENITSGLDQLSKKFGSLSLSPVYESEPVGFSGSCFLNLVVELQCELSLSELSSCLKQIEDKHGRKRSGPKFSPRTLDIDILTYGNLIGVHEDIELPRPELYFNGFVLLPIAELAPHKVDPNTDLSYQDLWKTHREKIESQQKLWRVDFAWPK